MLDLGDRVTSSILEYLRRILCGTCIDGDIDVLVDRRGDEEPPVFPVVGGQVGAAAAEGDAQGGPGDDHQGRAYSPAQ